MVKRKKAIKPIFEKMEVGTTETWDIKRMESVRNSLDRYKVTGGRGKEFKTKREGAVIKVTRIA